MMSPATQSAARPSVALSIVIFVCSVVVMALLRLHFFGERIITLSYGLPLLLCLWQRDRWLLWAMSATFIAMAAVKSFMMLPSEHFDFHFELLNCAMHSLNVAVIAGAVHVILNLLDRLRERNERIEQTNHELMQRDEEITRQNEELAQQNEEIQQQAEEVYQQSEELQAQAEELQAANSEAGKRQRALQMLLESLDSDGERAVLERFCRSLLELVGDSAVAAAVVQRSGDELVSIAHAGEAGTSTVRVPFSRSFAAIVMQQNQTAFIEDVADRPDLVVACTAEQPIVSVLATPLRLNGEPMGAIKIYSAKPCRWTKEQFIVVEWVAAQCSLVLQAKRLEASLKETNARLDGLVAERTAALKDMVNDLEHFSYTITHDMRAPLRAMHGFADILAEQLRGRLDDESQNYLARIMRAATRMDRLITDALCYATTMKQEMTLSTVDVGTLLRGILESYPEFQSPNARIEIAREFPPVLANEAGLTQCFSNLLHNAVKFVEKGRVPSISVRAEPIDGHIRLWFEDNGVGIPRELHSRVFVMFHRLSKEYDGTGIGLALVKKAAERMGGRVGLDSEPGRGSRFWIDLRPTAAKLSS